MKREKIFYFPDTNPPYSADELQKPAEVLGDSPCPCCGFITIPNGGDALAYICPVCCWEIDLFIPWGEPGAEEMPSDQNHGLTLAQARENYQRYGASTPRAKGYCRKPTKGEIPQR